MTSIPSEAELRLRVRAFDPIQKRVFGAMIVHMLQERERLRDREWISERFAETTAMALDLDLEAGDAADGVERVRSYAQEHMSTILDAAFGVFVRVAETMAARPDGFSFQDASDEALGYLTGGDSGIIEA